MSSNYKYLPSQLADCLRNMRITAPRPVRGSIEGLHRSMDYGSSVEFAEYREYTPGDPINLIDWPVYARSDKYMIRRFYEETNLRAYILLDTSKSLAFRDMGLISKMEYALFLAAGLMYILINQGDSVGLMTFDKKILKIFEPVSTFEGIRPVLLELEGIIPSGESDIAAVIHQSAELIQSKSLIVVISDLLQDVAEIIRGIRHLYHCGHNIMVFHVMDRGEMQLSFGGVAEFRDIETSTRMVVEIDEIKDAYESAVKEYLNELRTECTECLVDYRLIDTKIPVEELLTQKVGYSSI